MNKISPHLWFDKEAKEAAAFYTSIFPNSKIKNTVTLEDTPSGTAEVITIDLAGQQFVLLNAGPYFKVNPSISFMVACESKEEVDGLWSKLSQGGQTMMELAEYPFSKWYGWTADKYGVSWQVMLTDQPIKQKITPTLMFVGDNAGKTEEAVNFYVSIFKDAGINFISHYGEGQAPNKPEMVNQASFKLEGQDFAAMDSSLQHEFTFSEAISLIVHCQGQEEHDYYFNKLSAVPESEQCGWLKDKYGVSWQVEPVELTNMLLDQDKEKVYRVSQALLPMKRLNVAELQKAFEGK